MADGAMYAALRRAMFLVPPERIHTLVFAGLRGATGRPALRRRAERTLGPSDPALASTVFGVRFPGPLGLAAGFDKDGRGLNTWGALGFGYAEVGTVTAQAQPGNPTPRLFRLPADRALLNRMGFNNHGAGELALRLARHSPDIPIGVNIGKTKVTPPEGAVDDYRASARLLGPLAAYLVVNVSSPNTPGLRDLQAVESLRPDPGGRAGRDVDSGAGEDRAGSVRRRRRRDRRSGSGIGPGRHRRDQHHGVAGRPAHPGGRRARLRRGVRTAGGAAIPGGPAPALRPGRRPAGADQRRRHRDRRRRLGAHRLRGVTCCRATRVSSTAAGGGPSTFTTASRSGCSAGGFASLADAVGIGTKG